MVELTKRQESVGGTVYLFICLFVYLFYLFKLFTAAYNNKVWSVIKYTALVQQLLGIKAKH